MSTEININKNIYNSDGTVNNNRTVDLDGNTLNFSGGNVGINQPTPSVPLHIKGTAIPSVNEPLVRLEVADATGAYLQMSNGILSNGEFVGEVVGRQNSSSNQSAVVFGGYIDATQDSGTTPVTVFRSALASLTQIATRPLFAFRNWSTTVMTMLANGNVGIGTTTPTEKLEVSGKTKTTTFQMTTTPTAGYVLTSDASGNGSWQLGGSASGRIGIANTNGIYTFYNDFTSALAAAVAGQTIEVFADITVTTATTYTLKDGVHINGNGHTFTNTHNTTSFNVFTDGGGNVSCNIINYRIVRNGTSSNGGNTINLQGTGTFDFTGTQIIRLANSDFGLCIGISNTVTVTNLYASSERGQVFNCISSSASFINCYFRQVSGSSSCGSNQGTMLGCTVLAQITTALSITGAAYVANCYINSGTGQAVTIIGGELVNSSCVSTTNYAVNISGGEVINCHIRSNSQNALFMGGGIVTQCRILTASAASINGNATVVRLYQSDVFCQWNDVNGHGIQRPLDVHQNRIRVSNLSAKGLFSSVAANTSYSQNQFVGPSTYSAPVSATITQTIINTEDNQGNLVI